MRSWTADNPLNYLNGRAVAVSISCLALLAACQTSAELTPLDRSPVTLVIGLPFAAEEDPLRGLQQASRLITSEGLISLGRDGRPQARLAEKWSQSDDGLVWTLTLRPNAAFHDGTPVDAGAVKQSLERTISGPERDLLPGLADVASIEAPSKDQLQIKLRARSSFLLDSLTVAILKQGNRNQQFGTGPFVPTSTTSDEVRMKALDGYYRGKPDIDEIVIRAFRGVRSAWAAMMRGEVDFLYDTGPEAAQFVSHLSTVNSYAFLRSYGLGVILNSRAAVLADPRIRRALNFAIDRENIIRLGLRGQGIPASDSAWPLHWAYDPSMSRFDYDPQRATALLDSVGLPRQPADGAAPARLRFRCIIPENFALWERLALHVQRDLAEVGVDLQLQLVPVAEFNQRIGKGDFDAVLMEFVVGNSPSRPYFFWHSQSPRNMWGYHNPDMDSALDGIRRAATDAEYKAAFRQFQLATLNDPPAIFLGLGETTRAVSNRFEVVAPAGTDILPTIAEWRLADPGARSTN